MMDHITFLLIAGGLMTALVLAVVVSVYYRRDLKRLVDQEREIRQLRRQLNDLIEHRRPE
jgi:hypothetical protein